MKIVKYPTYYAPASGEVNFQVSAEIDELVEIEILAGDDNTLIGKKRFRNATLYNVNVTGYARRQIDVTPQRPSSISFAQPTDRLSKITIRSGSVQGSTVVAAGNNPLDSYIKLSASPETIPISRSQRDELALLVDDGLPLSVEARLHGRNGDKTLTIIDTQEVGELSVICLNMTQLDAKLRTLEYGTLSDFDNMEVALMIDTDQLFAQKYVFIPDKPDQIRLCWWNSFGQIDYYTWRQQTQIDLYSEKNRIYTQQGYKTIQNKSEQHRHLFSGFISRKTMDWISEIITAPRVWIDHGSSIEPIEILSDQITTFDENLLQIELETIPSIQTQHTHL